MSGQWEVTEGSQHGEGWLAAVDNNWRRMALDGDSGISGLFIIANILFPWGVGMLLQTSYQI